MNLFALAALLAVAELGLVLIVKLQRRSFPWLITEKDEVPVLDSRAVQKFLNSSFDPHLGWVRKSNTSGVERGQTGEINFHIDSAGGRASPYGVAPAFVAAFGDSYVFCRQVEDGETWESQLARHEGYRVLNFGVGNYGVDQALLRYEGISLPPTVRVVVLGFVPETICRVQSCWKHYLEFGNTLAFKPRFMLNLDGKLTLIQNPMQTADDFADLPAKLPKLRELDGFYERKFRRRQFRFPYLASLMRNPIQQVRLILAVALRGFLRCLGLAKPWSENLPFALVMKENLRDAHRLYNDRESVDLLTAILLRFRDEARRRGHVPLVLVTPQLLDLKLAKKNGTPYQDFYRKLEPTLPVLDLTDKFLGSKYTDLYMNDQYGGHLTVAGNHLVAREISAWLRRSNLLR